jgi:hypothetical protein
MKRKLSFENKFEKVWKILILISIALLLLICKRLKIFKYIEKRPEFSYVYDM